jgi:Transmembrane adaptor Erv26
MYRGPQSRIPGFADIATFFAICVWLAPLFLFLSLSAADNTLPTSTGLSRFASDLDDSASQFQ